jgi:hypothetical protein
MKEEDFDDDNEFGDEFEDDEDKPKSKKSSGKKKSKRSALLDVKIKFEGVTLAPFAIYKIETGLEVNPVTHEPNFTLILEGLFQSGEKKFYYATEVIRDEKREELEDLLKRAGTVILEKED